MLELRNGEYAIGANLDLGGTSRWLTFG
jgi:hypothetical protein